MTKEQVQMLRDAGISETAIIDRILQETAQAVSPEAKPADPEAKPADPEPAPEPEKPADPAPEPVPQEPREDKIIAAIEKLTGAIYAKNIGSIGTETGGQETVENILNNAYYKGG